MVDTPWGSPGAGQKQNEALKIPLHADYHVGQFGIDAQINGGVKSWEQQFSSQVVHLNTTSSRLNLCLWGLAWQFSSEKERYLILRRHGLSSSSD